MRTISLALALFLVPGVNAQTTLFSEDFEGTPAFALNTSDQGGATGSPDNTWLINNAYAGGNGSVVCLGFPLPFSVSGTPSQPAGITSPNGKYMHITSVAAQNSGILSCCFLAADGLCANAASHFVRMTPDVTTGAGDITLSFWWLCMGGASNYGEVYYSTDGGTSWNLVSTPIAQYRDQSNWVQQSITLPAFSNQATLRFGFRFVNGTTSSASDPAFAVDDVRIVAATAVPNSISTNAIAPTDHCQGAALSVPFTAVGSYNAGNVFSAELSDATGGFATPVVIGTLNGTVSGTISCTIPALTPVGTGYRVRVVSSDPATVGTANAADISVSAAPYAGADDQVVLCKNSGTYDLFQFLPGASACGMWTGPLGPFSGQLNTAADPAGAYTYTTDCPGGCPQDAATLTVLLQNPANAGNDVNVALCANGSPVSLVSYVSGGDLTGIFYYNGVPTTGGQLSTPGTYAIEYVVFGTAPCTNDTADLVFTVNAPPDAGTSASATVCQNAPPVQLVTLLGGTPQPGGTWTGPGGGTVSGTLNPASGASGLYTYTVNGVAPCANAQAFVAVVIDPCSGMEEVARDAHGLRWLGQEGAGHAVLIGGDAVEGFELLDAAGRIVTRINGPFAAGRAFLDPGPIPSGFYVLRALGENGGGLRLQHQARY